MNIAKPRHWNFLDERLNAAKSGRWNFLGERLNVATSGRSLRLRVMRHLGRALAPALPLTRHHVEFPPVDRPKSD